jgi:hypothetical protein
MSVKSVKSVKNALAHALAGAGGNLIPYGFQIIKLDTFPIVHRRGIVSDVEEVAWHRGPSRELERTRRVVVQSILGEKLATT